MLFYLKAIHLSIFEKINFLSVHGTTTCDAEERRRKWKWDYAQRTDVNWAVEMKGMSEVTIQWKLKER